jgi:hypothetical protein
VELADGLMEEGKQGSVQMIGFVVLEDLMA